jgi:hypothetical protein
MDNQLYKNGINIHSILTQLVIQEDFVALVTS